MLVGARRARIQATTVTGTASRLLPRDGHNDDSIPALFAGTEGVEELKTVTLIMNLKLCLGVSNFGVICHRFPDKNWRTLYSSLGIFRFRIGPKTHATAKSVIYSTLYG